MILLVPAVIAVLDWARRKQRRRRRVWRRIEEGKLGVEKETWEVVPRVEVNGGKVEIGGEEVEREGQLDGGPVVIGWSDGEGELVGVKEGEDVMGCIEVFCTFSLWRN